MTIDYQKLRLYGVYQQDKEENLMLRVKIPAGFLSSQQAKTIAAISKECSNGMLHLTSRGSVEFHWLKHHQLDDIFDRLTKVGLTTRGACGGAVRGISCSSTFAPEFPVAQAIAQKLNQHFAGNPNFEGLPKKFKISIDAGYQNARHLIQDLGIVLVDGRSGQKTYDVWCAGGLGRQPQAGFLLAEAVPEEDLIHLVESVVHVYRDNTPPPKRLKFLLASIGETEFRRLLDEEMNRRQYVKFYGDVKGSLVAPKGIFVTVPVFAGELNADTLEQLAAIATDKAGGYLATTADQNIAILTSSTSEEMAINTALRGAELTTSSSLMIANFRVCPGNHECRMGLSATRDVARQMIALAGESASAKSWAISGCRNSCSQPQLADYGIVTSKLASEKNGERQPLFDLYRRQGNELGKCVAENLSDAALYDMIPALE
jgi:sulfite reductase beta subunit-like hemoprotein